MIQKYLFKNLHSVLSLDKLQIEVYITVKRNSINQGVDNEKVKHMTFKGPLSLNVCVGTYVINGMSSKDP